MSSSDQKRIAAEREAQTIRRTHRGIVTGGLVVLGSQLMIGFVRNSWVAGRVTAVMLLAFSLLPLVVEIPLATSTGLTGFVRKALMWMLWVVALVLSITAGVLIFQGFGTQDVAAAVAATFLAIIPMALNTWALYSALRLLHLSRSLA